MGQCPVVCLSHIDNDGTVARGVSTSRYPIVPSLFRPTMLYIKAGAASMAGAWYTSWYKKRRDDGTPGGRYATGHCPVVVYV